MASKTRTRKAPAGDATRAVAYLRVSTEDQHLGPEAQRAAIETWARARGVTVCAWHCDQGVSGAAPIDRRPAMLAALSDLKTQRAGILVVAKRDRLARDTMIAAMAERMVAAAGACVASAAGEGDGTGPEAQLMRTLVDAFAQYERALIAARTKAALAVKKRRGERVGTLPYGKCVAADGKKLDLDPAEVRVVEIVRELRGEGLSLRAIAAHLTDLELRPRSGGVWFPQTVARIAAAA